LRGKVSLATPISPVPAMICSKIPGYPIMAVPALMAKKLGRPVMMRITRIEEYARAEQWAGRARLSRIR
jgi:hypothetical protein